MKLKYSLFLLFLFLILYVPLVKSDLFSITSVYWGSLQTPMLVSPGDAGVLLNVAVRYEGSAIIRGVKGKLYLPSPFSGYYGENPVSSIYLGVVNPGDIVILSFRVSIPQNISLGSYRAFLEIEYYDTKNQVVSIVSSFPIQFSILGKPKLTISLLNNSIEYSKVSDLYFNVSNNGLGNAYNLFLYITSSSLQLISGSSYDLGTLKSGESKTVKISVYATSQQSQGYINLQLSGVDGAGNQVVTTQSFGVIVTSQLSSSFKLINNVSLKVGYINDVLLVFRNNGYLKKDVSFSFIFPSQIVVYSFPNAFFNEVLPLSELKLPISIYVPDNFPSGVITAIVTISYRSEAGSNYVESVSIPFMLTNPINLTLYGISQSPTLVYPNSSITISGNVLNRGSVAAKYVNVSLGTLPQGFYSFPASSSYYIGDLPSDSISSFSLILYVENVSPGTYRIPLVVQYLDDLKQTRQQTVDYLLVISKGEAHVSSQGNQTPGSNNFVLVTLLALLALVAVVVLFVLRRKSGVK
ncbi:MAG: COG1361 S-layer family protein [Thermoproteota archaeon]